MIPEISSALLLDSEVRAVAEALELVLGDYEDEYFNLENHDSPEDWVMFREQYREWAATYVKLAGRPFQGARCWWDVEGPHDGTSEGGQVRAE